MSTRVETGTVVPERSTRLYTVTLTNRAGAAVTPNQVDSVTATIRDLDTGFLLLDHADVFGDNGGSLDMTSGLFSLELLSEYHRIVNPIRRPNTMERRLLTLDFVYSNGDQEETHEVEYKVEAFQDR